MPNFWIITPPDAALSDLQGWAKTGANQYAAIRHHLLVVPRNGGIMNGPIHRQMDWPVKAEFRMMDSIKSITRFTYSLQESITSSVTSKLTQELLSKVNSSIGVGLTKLEATLGSELQTRISSELVENLQRGLSTVSTYSVETERQKEEGFKFEVPANDGSSGTRPVFIYFKLRQLFWDVFLYRTDYLQLEYKPNWLWPDVRRTIVHENVVLRQPLFTLEFFEPFSDFSFAFDSYQPGVENGDGVLSVALLSPCPPVALPSALTLEQLAKLAFPVSRDERDKAKKQRAQYSAARAAGPSAAGRSQASGKSVSTSAKKATSGRSASASSKTRASSSSKGGTSSSSRSKSVSGKAGASSGRMGAGSGKSGASSSRSKSTSGKAGSSSGKSSKAGHSSSKSRGSGGRL